MPVIIDGRGSGYSAAVDSENRLLTYDPEVDERIRALENKIDKLAESVGIIKSILTGNKIINGGERLKRRMDSK